jgi:hypothetical protein
MRNGNGHSSEKQSPDIKRPPLKRHSVMTRITSGKVLVADSDGRSLWSRRMRDLMALYTSDRGGEDQLSEAQRSMIRRIAVLEIELEQMEQRFAADDRTPSLIHQYQRVVNTSRRLHQVLGISRVAKDISPPTIDQYAEQVRRREGPAP